MAIPMRQSARIGWYLFSKKIRKVEKLTGGPAGSAHVNESSSIAEFMPPSFRK